LAGFAVSKWLKNIIGIVILAFLVFYLFRRWDELKVLVKIKPSRIAMISILGFLFTFVRGAVVLSLLRPLKIYPKFWDMVWLNNAAILLNYVPAKAGTIFRANFMKRHCGLGYTHFAMFVTYTAMLMIVVSMMAGLIALVTVYGLGGKENKVLALVQISALIVSVVLLTVPLPMPRGEGKIRSRLRDFLNGRSEISRDKKAVLITMVFMCVNLVVTSLRMMVVYSTVTVGTKLHPAAFLIIGGLEYVIFFVGFTPGSLGLKELVLASGAMAIGVNFDVGLLAAMIDRVVMTCYIFVVGGISAIYLWRKSPEDFKEVETAPAKMD